MLDTKHFSVAISVYKNDRPSFFSRDLDSIIRFQTIRPSEICLVVDGPVPDEINKIIDEYKKSFPLFKIIRLEKNYGLGNALKLATEAASYELIARMDSDDISSPDRFEQQLKFYEKNQTLDVVGGDISEFIGEEKNVVAKRIVPQENKRIRKYMKKRCAFNHVSVMFKKSSVLSAGGYQDWPWNEDYYLWIRMWLNNAVFANTGTVLVNVRTGEEMYLRRGGKKYFKSEKELQKYMYKHKMIGWWTYCFNCLKRFIVQIILPNSLRGWVLRNFARKK